MKTTILVSVILSTALFSSLSMAITMPRDFQEELEQVCLAIVYDNPEALTKEVNELYPPGPEKHNLRVVTQDLVCNGYTAEEFARVKGSEANTELLAEKSTSVSA